MPLRSIAVENYRCFRDRQELEIHPVTVVFGRNNSGKSALVRAPLVFSTGFGADTTAPLDADRLAELGLDTVDSFPDLIFGRAKHGWIGVELVVDGENAFTLNARLQHIDELDRAVVSRLTMGDASEEYEFEWDRILPPDLEPMDYIVRRSNSEEESIHDLAFRGMLPEPSSADPRLAAWLRIERSLGTIRFLSSYREPPTSHHRLPFGEPKSLGPHGQGAAGLLAHARVRGRGELIDIVNGLLDIIVPGWEIDEVGAGGLWTTVLRRRGDREGVNLVDGGSGMAQVLPLLVQCALDQQRGQAAEPVLQIIEEPEMHLHPAAHLGLADVYLQTARATGTRFLIETHSEALLLRLRRRIAEGACAPDMVGIYIVEQHDGASTVRRVEVDEVGNLSDEWPEGYFSQDYHEVRAIAAAQLDRTADVA